MTWRQVQNRRPKGTLLPSLVGLLTVLATSACAGTAPPSTQAPREAGQGSEQAPRAQTTLRFVTRFEVQTLAYKFDEPGGGSGGYAKRPFNAGLAVIDTQTQPRPALAEQLPQL